MEKSWDFDPVHDLFISYFFTLIYILPFSWLKCCFTSTETVGLLGTGAQDGHLDFRTAPELCVTVQGPPDQTIMPKLETGLYRLVNYDG